MDSAVSQQPATELYTELDTSAPLRSILILSSQLQLRLLSNILTFPNKIVRLCPAPPPNPKIPWSQGYTNSPKNLGATSKF
jgi:hypothetical protein